jgi:hypothetical protein
MDLDFDPPEGESCGTVTLRNSTRDGSPTVSTTLKLDVAKEVRGAFTFAALSKEKGLRVVFYLDKRSSDEPNIISVSSIWAMSEMDLTES